MDAPAPLGDAIVTLVLAITETVDAAVMLADVPAVIAVPALVLTVRLVFVNELAYAGP